MKIVVFSCDNYLWLSPIFLHFYRKYWPDNPYQTDFITEEGRIEGENVFQTGHVPWFNKITNYLKSFEDELFIFLLIDQILNKEVDTKRVRAAERFCKDDIGCVRLYPYDRLSHFLINTNIKGYKEYPLNKPYSMSLQPSVWQKAFFLNLLVEGKTIWRMETFGSKLIQELDKRVIWVNDPIWSHCNPPAGYMQKGKVIDSVAKWMEENW